MDIRTSIADCKNGNTEAFGFVVEKLRQPLFRLAFRLLCDEEDAKDAVQDTFVKAWLAMGKYDPEQRFETWIYRIAVNVCYDRMRAGRRRKVYGRPAGDYADDAADTEAKLVNRELRESIMSLTQGLSVKQKLVFTLADLEELSTEEIRKATGLSTASVKSNLYLARKHIRENLKL